MRKRVFIVRWYCSDRLTERRKASVRLAGTSTEIEPGTSYVKLRNVAVP